MYGVQGGDSVHTQVSGPPYSLPLKNLLNEPWQEIFLEILKCYLNGAGGSNSIAYRINLVGCPSSADFKKHRLLEIQGKGTANSSEVLCLLGGPHLEFTEAALQRFFVVPGFSFALKSVTP